MFPGFLQKRVKKCITSRLYWLN